MTKKMPKTKNRRQATYYNRSIAFSDECGRLRRVCSRKNYKISRRRVSQNNRTSVVIKPKLWFRKLKNVPGLNLMDQVTLTKRRISRPKTKALTLEDLPEYVLRDIFSKVNIWHHNRLRFCSQRLCDVHVEYLISRFLVIRHKGSKEDRNIMDAIYEATLVFMNFDPYRKILAGFLLELFRDHYNRPFDPRMIKNFCFQYFRFCENYNRTIKLHSPYLMSLCTALRLLKGLTVSPMERSFLGEKMCILARISDRTLSIYQKQPKNNEGQADFINRFLAMLVELKIFLDNPSCLPRNDLDFINWSVVVEPKRITMVFLNFKYNYQLQELCRKFCEDDEVEVPSVWPQLKFTPEIKLVGSRIN